MNYNYFKSFTPKCTTRTFIRPYSLFGIVIYIVLTILLIFAIVCELKDHKQMKDLPNRSENRDKDESFYTCYEKVMWRQNYIAGYIASLIILYVLYILNFPVSLFLFLIIFVIVFLSFFCISSYMSYHWYRELCIKASS